LCLLAALAISCSDVSAAAKKAEPGVPLTADGEKLLAKYSAMLTSLQAEVAKAMPAVDEQKKATFLTAVKDEMAAAAAEVKALNAASAKGVTNKEEVGKAHKAAQETSAQARANAMQAAKILLADVEPFLANDKLDAKLVKCIVLAEATPRGLAEVAQQDKEQEALVEKLLADDILMKQMLIAGGAEDGKYGQAMQIYTAIQKASPKAGEGILQRLALGTSLAHAVPIVQSNPKDQTNAPATVDPVKRYLHYEKAFLDGELDPAFKDMSVWEYRMIVNSDAPDHILAWGREMLRNYRPDHIRTANEGWRYSIIVKTDVLYGSQDVKNDIPSLQNYQNIIKNGGVCGRRAFFARFLLRSFGIPVYGVTQHAHAAVGRWTPKGWVVNLGAAFKWSWWRERSGTDFLLETQARKAPRDYLKVLRAQWVGNVLGEQDYNDRKSAVGGFWKAAAQYKARAIAAEAKAIELRPVGQDVAESNESKEVDAVEKARMAEADRKIVIGGDGVITIPAVAISKPTGNTAQFLSMKSFSGGMQLHCVRDLKAAQEFEYALEAPQAGKYALVARVVTVQSDQKLLLKPNDAKEPVEIAVPYTIGRWEQTQPVEIALVKGRNVLHFTRPAPSRGLTIKHFTLTPVK
jgi:hypothetical protein